MKLSDHRALQGALLLSAAIFTICQARPQSTGTGTTTLGNAEVPSHSQENGKSKEEEAIRYNASAHSSRFNTSNFTNETRLESASTIVNVSRNITGYHVLGSGLDSKYNVTAIGSQDNDPNIHNNGLDQGSNVSIFINDSNSQDSWNHLNNTLNNQVKNKPFKHLENSKSVQIHTNTSAKLTDISTNSYLHQSNNYSSEQSISVIEQRFLNSNKMLNSTQGSNCTQLCLENYSINISKHEEHFSPRNISQPSLHTDTNNYTVTLKPQSSPKGILAYIYAQHPPNVQDAISTPRNDSIIPSYSQNISNPSVNQSSSSGTTTDHSITIQTAAYEVTPDKVLLNLMSLSTISPAYLPPSGENSTHSNTQMNNSVSDLFATIQNVSFSNTNSSRARAEPSQTLVPQGIHLAAEFLKNQNVINTIKQWGGSLINKVSKIFKPSFGSTTEDSQASINSSNRKGRLFLKNGTEPLQMVYFVPAQSASVINDGYLQSKASFKNQSSGAKTNVNENNITNVYRKRHNSSRNGNSTRPYNSIIRRYEKQKLLPKVKTRLIRRNNQTNLTEGSKQVMREFLPITLHSHKNNSSSRTMPKAANITHVLFNNVANGTAHQASAWLPIGLPSQTEGSENLELSQSRNSGKECVIKSSTGEIRPCNRKRNTTEVTQKRFQNSNQTPKTLQHGDGLVKNFVSTNIHDLRAPSKEYPNKNIGVPSSSSPSSLFAFNKNWPGDTANIESLDDLILYHTYTQNKPSVTVKPQPDGGVVSVIKKPSVTLHWDQTPSTVTSSPTVTYKPTQTSKRPAVTIQSTKYVYDYDYNTGSSAAPDTSYLPSTTMYPVVLITPRPPHQPSTHSPYYPPSYDTPLAQDEFYDEPSSTVAAPSKCPNIIISTKGNATVGTKENCPDVNILITSDITNNNVLVGGSSTTEANRPPPFSDEVFTTPAAPTMMSPPTSITSSLSNVISGMMSSQLAYPMLYFFLAPLLVVLTGGIGLAALMFPWMFAWRSLGREERRLQKKSLLVEEFDQSRRRRSVDNTCSCWDWNLSDKGFSGMLHSGKKKPKRRKRSHEVLDSYHVWWMDHNT